ncbi:MAG: galactokinase [Oscillospiraceae bacterium]|nr:galactokinase [Oscillospiraceae bacterium]
MKNIDEMLERLYGADAVSAQNVRYSGAERTFYQFFGSAQEPMIFSASGRTEIGGNHTDHNRGKVIAAAVGLDVIAFVVPSDDGIITIKSEGFPKDSVDTADLSVHAEEKNSSAALIRGVADGFVKNGFSVGGFRAYTTSNVLKGSGISSSAAFEVLIGTILSHLYNEGKVNMVKIAQIAQYAENVHFGKPSGLMDQMASAVGGFIEIDFADTQKPVITEIDYDFTASGHSLCIVDTKGDHADLTPEYAAIPAEMKSVAQFFGKSELRDITREQLWEKISEVRTSCGDRAVSRAMHFFDENDRADRETEALRNGDFDSFLKVVAESGNSSFKYLQNIFASVDPRQQAMVLGLYAAESVLKGRGACRVHGGGFAGTIQAFVPNDLLGEFTAKMEGLFGAGSCYSLYIRPIGGCAVSK